MLLAASVPALAMRALLHLRHDDRPVLARGFLYLMFAIPSLFTLTYSLTRMAGVDRHLSAIWILGWIAIGVLLYFSEGRNKPPPHAAGVTWLRVVHGAIALCLLCGFLLAHLINHDLAAWSITLHGTAMKWLRLWYRSEWVEPVLLGLLFVMICTGVPMVVHHSRRRMDAFRVVQMATGVYIGVFLCSHVLAVLNGRRAGVETDWAFAAGPTSLLDGIGLRGRLIPHYFMAALVLVLHVACGLRVILLQHGVARVVGNRVLYGLASLALVVTVLSMAALLGFHAKAAH
jgi:succinate dehydrogenase/fumarate reductase cytochrome b subunit